MNRDAIRTLVLEKLCQVAPDIVPDQLDPAVNIRDQYDFDSMDLLNFVIAVHKATQIDIPEKDYNQLLSLDTMIDYLASRLS